MLSPASGTGKFALRSCKVIRFVRLGCTNRPFYHIVIQEVKTLILYHFIFFNSIYTLEKKRAIYASY